jgi:hypothetical protein
LEAERPRLPGRVRGGGGRVGQGQRQPGPDVHPGKLGSFTVGADKSVLLGPPFVFTSANISQFNF